MDSPLVLDKEFEMLSDRQKKGMKITISDSDFWDVQDMLDEALGHFDGNVTTKNMIAAANSNKKNVYVNLRDEGWHQLESYDGKQFKHIKVEYLGLEFHCYSLVSGAMDNPKTATHTISQITYVNFNAPKTYMVTVDRA